MSVSRRVGALLCALALILHLAFVPLRARAFAGVLPAVGAGVVVTAALMASGIYPYEEAEDFSNYVTNNLEKLWKQYTDWRAQNQMSPPETGNELSKITAFLSAGTLLIADKVWRTLVDFVSWIIDEFQVTDNQAGVELGTVSSAAIALPYYSSRPSFSELSATGFQARTNSGVSYFGTTLKRDNYPVGIVAAIPSSSAWYLCFCAGTSPSGSGFLKGSGSSVSNTQFDEEVTASDGTKFYINRYTYTQYSVSVSSPPAEWVSLGIPIFNRGEGRFMVDYFQSFVGQTRPSETFFGVTADTTTVSALPALPSDTPWGGLAVEGAGTAATVGAVEQVIQDGVTEREKPEVEVVEVELGANTDVDAETGAVTENPVVVTPDTVIPAVSELTAPQAFLDTLQSAMQTKFPFCLPFDVMRILSALSRQPQAPLIKLTFHDSFSDADYTIEVDLSPWNSVAAIVREMQSILLLLGFWLNFDKFNVLNIILGQLG